MSIVCIVGWCATGLRFVYGILSSDHVYADGSVEAAVHGSELDCLDHDRSRCERRARGRRCARICAVVFIFDWRFAASFGCTKVNKNSFFNESSKSVFFLNRILFFIRRKNNVWFSILQAWFSRCCVVETTAIGFRECCSIEDRHRADRCNVWHGEP